MFVFFFFKHKTAYEMRISDWSSDVCSSDLGRLRCFRVLENLNQSNVDLRSSVLGCSSVSGFWRKGSKDHVDIDDTPGQQRDGERILPLLAAIIDQSAANAGGQVMPDRIDLWSIPRRALQEQHDQHRETPKDHPASTRNHH